MIDRNVKVLCAMTITFFTRLSVGLIALGLLGGLAGCVNFEYHETKTVRVERIDESQELLSDEQELLDVGIVLFDPGVDILDDDSAAFSNVRQSEAVWFSSQLKTTLEYSNAWGLIRTLPNDSAIMDLMVAGKLLESNGETVRLQVSATDSTGKVWIDKEYFQRASQYAYNPEVNLPDDPFQAMFNEIANDLFNYRATLDSQQLLGIRSVSKVLFARDFVPQAFDSFVSESEDGIVTLQRIPASSDPMMQRVERIQARNDLYLDVVQDYYRAFNKNMSSPYNEWRKISYKEVLYERQLREQARRERIAGVAVLAGGVAAATTSDSRAGRASGQLAVLGGARIFANSIAKKDESLLHSQTLREMGASLESQLEPSVIDLQDRSITLSGTVDDQFIEWRRILGRMFELEEGVSLDQALPVSDEGTDGVLIDTEAVPTSTVDTQTP